jgi:hypothetical protein
VATFDPERLRKDSSNAQEAKISVARAPVGIAARPNIRRIWVANSNRFAAPRAPGAIETGGFPRELVWTPAAERLIVTAFAAGAVQIVPDSGQGLGAPQAPNVRLTPPEERHASRCTPPRD